MRWFISIILLLCFLQPEAYAQKSRLASQYYSNGEYEKAAYLYLDLYKENNSLSYFKSYVRNLDLAGEEEKAIEEIKKEIKNRPSEVSLYVTLGSMLEGNGDLDEANKYFNLAVDRLSPNKNEIRNIGSEFVRAVKYDLAIDVFEKGIELVGQDPNILYLLGDTYRRKGNMEAMIDNYLHSLVLQPYRLKTIESKFQTYLEKEDFDTLKIKIFDLIRETESPELYELLIWSHIYTRNYAAALRQGIALDKRNAEAGKRVMNISKTALNEDAYDTAIKGFQYVIDSKGNMNPYYFDATEYLLSAKREKILSSEYIEDELISLKTEYKNYLIRFGKNKYSAGIIRNLAFLQSNYLGELDSAIVLLTEALEIRDLDRNTRAEIKLDLGDYYLIQNERWESTLLYSQVDKDFEEDPLGHEARYRNAKLAYYMGDFEWAQVQFDVLKASTSKLISNDAIDMSVFILDNLGLDTSTIALERFARSDLYAIQHHYDSAFALLRQIKLDFPDHSLLDDVIYREAGLYAKMKAYDKAIERYEYLIDNYYDDIKADNSVFELAEIYEKVVKDEDKALELYEKIFVDFDSSTFAAEARKRYRLLRGDET